MMFVPMKVPLLDLRRQNLPMEAELVEAFRRVLRSGQFGQAADMDPVLEIARRRGLAVIEDAAQAFGAVYRGRPVGSLGDFGTVSFFPTKNLGALGDAGLLVTNNEALAEKARLLRNHGDAVVAAITGFLESSA
jgi:dTDP-4-amino-4,6-dideoxygalactose transaminase